MTREKDGVSGLPHSNGIPSGCVWRGEGDFKLARVRSKSLSDTSHRFASYLTRWLQCCSVWHAPSTVWMFHRNERHELRSKKISPSYKIDLNSSKCSKLEPVNQKSVWSDARMLPSQSHLQSKARASSSIAYSQLDHPLPLPHRFRNWLTITRR